MFALVLFVSNGMVAQGPPPPPPVNTISSDDGFDHNYSDEETHFVIRTNGDYEVQQSGESVRTLNLPDWTDERDAYYMDSTYTQISEGDDWD